MWRCRQGHEYDPTIYGYPSESGDPCPTCARERRDEAMRLVGMETQRDCDARERRERQGTPIDVQTPSTIEIEREELRGLLDEAKADRAALQAQVEALTAERERLRKACVQVRGALVLDAMVDDRGRPYGTTWVALQAIAEALGERAIVGGAAEGGGAL